MDEKDLKKYKLIYVRDLVRYLSGNVKIDKSNQGEYERCINLKRIIDIYDSPISDYSKAYEISKIFSTYKKLERDTSSPLKYDEDEFLGEYVKKLKYILSFYSDSSQNGVIDEANYLINIKDYFSSYEYAKFIVSSYVNYSDSVVTANFLDEVGINLDTFNYCLSVIGELDPELYDLYNKKSLLNKETRMADTKSSLDNIVCGIKTGYKLDGTSFDILDFLKLLPFDNQLSSREILTDYDVRITTDFSTRIRSLINSIVPEEYNRIVGYMNENKINAYTFRPINLNEIYNTKVIVNGREITREDKEIILSYIQENNLPMVDKSYDAVRDKYLNGEITKEDVKSKKYVPKFKCTLIP